jgi:hypothetical protein
LIFSYLICICLKPGQSSVSSSYLASVSGEIVIIYFVDSGREKFFSEKANHFIYFKEFPFMLVVVI